MATRRFTEVLDEFRIVTLDDYVSLSPDRKLHFHRLLYNSFGDETKRSLADIRELGGVKFHFRSSLGHDRQHENWPTAAFLKKSAFYASKTLITFPLTDIQDKRELRQFSDKHATAKQVGSAHRIYWGNISKSFRMMGGPVYRVDPDALRDFITLVTSHRSAVELGIVSVLPVFPETERQLRNKNLGLIPANFRLNSLRTQFFETGPLDQLTRQRSHFVPKLLLPHFSNVPLDRVLEIRKSEATLHAEFQRRLEALIFDASETDSERAILNFLREVDLGVRELDKRFKDLQARYRRRNVETLLKFLVVGLVTLIPVDPATKVALNGIIGGMTAFEYITVHREFADEHFILAHDRFYLPWLVFKADTRPHE